MLFGGYEHWMLRFWTLRKLDATLLDALIATRRIGVRFAISGGTPYKFDIFRAEDPRGVTARDPGLGLGCRQFFFF